MKCPRSSHTHSRAGDTWSPFCSLLRSPSAALQLSQLDKSLYFWYQLLLCSDLQIVPTEMFPPEVHLTTCCALLLSSSPGRARRLQPLHLSPPPGVWRRRAHANVPAVRQRHLCQSFCGPSDQSEQMFWWVKTRPGVVVVVVVAALIDRAQPTLLITSTGFAAAAAVLSQHKPALAPTGLQPRPPLPHLHLPSSDTYSAARPHVEN